MPRGVGKSPVKIVLSVRDDLSGLDEIVVRASQRSKDFELLREKLGADKSREIELLIDGERSGLEEGSLNLSIRVFDRSFWSNREEVLKSIPVDYRNPSVEVVSTQHNARLGGSQLVFYKAIDQNLAISGVRVGSTTFVGYPARSFDPEFTDPNLFGAIYSVDLNIDPSLVTPRIFAEDEVGNASSVEFYNKVLPRRVPARDRNLSEQLMREIVPRILNQRGAAVELYLRQRGSPVEYRTPSGSSERLIEQFIRVQEIVRTMDETEIRRSVADSRYDWYLNGPLSLPLGTPVKQFGDRISYSYDGHDLGTVWFRGYQFGELRGAGPEVVSAGQGVITMAKELGSYGRTIVVDHGLGVSSVYAQLGKIDASPGSIVEAGEVIGEIGNSGLTDRKGMFFQVRINGEPVDPREWWDARWFYAHISGKIDEVKRVLGINAF
jgi:hypothetical protein